MRPILSILIFCLILTNIMAQAPTTIAFSPAMPYSFINIDNNYLQNTPALYPLFDKLSTQKSTNNQRVSIVHIGDSHTQADFFSGKVRENIHRDFGAAGRGLVVPLKVAGTNEPINYTSYSPIKWQSKRICFPEQALPIGIGGVTIQTNNPNAQLSFRIPNAMGIDYKFSSLKVFAEANQTFEFQLQDGLGNEIGYLRSTDFYDNVATIYLQTAVNEITFVAKNSNGGTQAQIYGIVFDNAVSGVLYHTIGVNAAKYEHYNVAQYFGTQLPYLSPDLTIIALGTNEAMKNISPENLRLEIDKLAQTIKNANPVGSILFVTPADSYLNRQSNPNLRIVRDVIVSYAQERGYAYWDMYEVLGAASTLKSNGILGGDGIHYSRAGYALQGDLLYDAFIKSYNSYILSKAIENK